MNKQAIFLMLLGVLLVVPKAGTASAEFTDDALREFHRFSQNQPCGVLNHGSREFWPVTWSGGCVDGKASGKGRMIFFWGGCSQPDNFGNINWNGRQYSGQLCKGKPYGSGILYHPNGFVFYEGSWVKGRFHGQGTEYYPNGTVLYSGNFYKDSFYGQGILYYPNGAIRYRGNFYYGEFDGVGTMHYPNGNIYDGSWHKNQPHGDGTMRYANGTKYVGRWAWGEPSKGILYYPNGTFEQVE